ncbi:MAG: rRNA maturation RNase YbeY [Hyphomicrobium sp.]
MKLDFVRLAGPWRMRKKLIAALEPILPTLVAHSGKLPPGTYFVTIALTDDRQQKELNHQFRGINKATNVLAFPQFTPRVLTRLKPGKEPVFLGDVSLAYQYVVGESKKDHKILCNHIIHLVIHGILHILGYDHQSSRQAAAMESLERIILDAMHIPDPYTSSPPTPRRAPRSNLL